MGIIDDKDKTMNKTKTKKKTIFTLFYVISFNNKKLKKFQIENKKNLLEQQ